MRNKIKSYNNNVIKKASQKAIKDISRFAEVMTGYTKEYSPYEYGTNRDSISFDVQGNKARVYTESGYGGWLELGTSKMTGRFYFLKAFKSTKRQLSK